MSASSDTAASSSEPPTSAWRATGGRAGAAGCAPAQRNMARAPTSTLLSLSSSSCAGPRSAAGDRSRTASIPAAPPPLSPALPPPPARWAGAQTLCLVLCSVLMLDAPPPTPPPPPAPAAASAHAPWLKTRPLLSVFCRRAGAERYASVGGVSSRGQAARGWAHAHSTQCQILGPAPVRGPHSGAADGRRRRAGAFRSRCQISNLHTIVLNSLNIHDRRDLRVHIEAESTPRAPTSQGFAPAAIKTTFVRWIVRSHPNCTGVVGHVAVDQHCNTMWYIPATRYYALRALSITQTLIT